MKNKDIRKSAKTQNLKNFIHTVQTWKYFHLYIKSIWPGHVIFLFTFKHPAMFPPTMSIDCHWLKHKTLWDVEKQTNRWSDLVKTCLPVLQILHLLVFLFKELMSTLSKKIEKKGKEKKIKVQIQLFLPVHFEHR